MKAFRKNGLSAVLGAEAEGLAALAGTGTIRVPAVLDFEDRGANATLVLEHLDFAPPDPGFGARLGDALARLHAHGRHDARTFGWPTDNFIGATPQVNTPTGDWVEFWRASRLVPMQSRLPTRLRGLHDAVSAVIDALPTFFRDGHLPRASLVHGDLWSGNWGMLADGTPVIFDPCVSYSDAEAELAMMELFGAPPAGFFEAYAANAGMHPGYARRRDLYQLYHLMNHAILFGGAYEAQALACARRLA